MTEAGVLYLVGTPLGNDGDFSSRALEVLREVDLIACEDTRTTGLLLGRFDIHKPRVSYHAHNLRARESELLEKLKEGLRIALVSDAGMPAISDPGSELVKACVREGIRVSVIPGPSALTTALAASALDTRRFVFEGFLEVKGKNRKEALQRLAVEKSSSVLYEAPHRLLKTLKDLEENGLGERRLCFCREMTKRYEEYLYMTVAEGLDYFQATEPRGEFVLVVEGLAEARERGVTAESPTQFDSEAFVQQNLASGVKVKVLAQRLAQEAGMTNNEAYAFIQAIKDNF